MTIVVPMAGRGARFANEGVTTPKPLIEVAGKPMVAWAMQSLRGVECSSVVFVALREHVEKFQLERLLPKIVDHPVELVSIEEVTEGQLCTVLAAAPKIDPAKGLLVASSDTYVVSNIGEEIRTAPKDCAGLISVADMEGDRWSFARTDEKGRVVEVAEKTRISNHASTGLYHFANAGDFLSRGCDLVRRQEKTRGEYYIMPLYQKLIQEGADIRLSHAAKMWDMGTPAALAHFLGGLAEEKPSGEH